MFQVLTLLFSMNAQEWKFSPQVYSRGGVTLSPALKYRGGTGMFNLGPWGDSSDLVNDPLTELTMNMTNGAFTYVYGVDINGNYRYDGDPVPLVERLNYFTWTQGKFAFWFGRRGEYRGTGRFLTGDFPFDERNMVGGGASFEVASGFKAEFALGRSNGAAVLVNKMEKSLNNGKIKTNLEYHRNQDPSLKQAVIGGAQLEKWGMKVGPGSLYNNFFVAASLGHVNGGTMQSIFTDASERVNGVNDTRGEDPYKVVANMNGDWKTDKLAFYYSGMLQMHSASGDAGSSWTFLDVYARPMFKLNNSFAVGVDAAARVVVDEGDVQKFPLWAFDYGNVADKNVYRLAGMLQYAPTSNVFGNPVVTFAAGSMFKGREVTYFEEASKQEFFLRFNYVVSI